MPGAPPPVAGLVLAGGLSRRMGGPDKALVPWAGQPLLAHALQRLAPQVGPLLVSHNRADPEVLALAARHGASVVPDTRPGHPGPLAGLLAALEHLAGRRDAPPWLAAVPCDAPRLPADLVARLVAAAADGLAMAATREADGSLRPQPTFLLLHRRLQPALAAALDHGRHRVLDWARSQGAVDVALDDGAAFANVNTPGDLAALDAPGAAREVT